MNAPRELLTETASSSQPIDRNQAWLVDQLAVLCARLRTGWANDGRDGATDPVVGALDEEDSLPPLERLAGLFGLSPFERDVLLLVAGYALDRDLRELLRQPPCLSLALASLPGAHWDAIAPQSPLRHWRLLEVPPDVPILEAPLCVDERILHFLTGVAAVDQYLGGIAVFRPPEGLGASESDSVADLLADATGDDDRVPTVWIDGAADGVRLLGIAIDAAHAAGQAPLVMSAADIPDEPRARFELARRLDREATLSNSVIVLANTGAEPAAEAMRQCAAFVEMLETPAIVCGRFDAIALRSVAGRNCIEVRVASADPGGSAAAVRRARAAHGDVIGLTLRRAASQFRVPSGVVDACLERIVPGDAAASQLWTALREASRGGLDQRAERIEARTTLADLVLPDAQIGQLHEIAAQLRWRHTVYDDWGFAERGSRGLGIAALFCGESGTGKTMAAEAVANDVGLDLYRIDLAGTVSKYIGETEKNLARIFDAAEASGAVLLFDEADALFGKRSEVKDSHDRYANIEVAYLLQRIESYRGLAILTTNLKSALDRSFQRRIRFVVNFPFPDPASRYLLWQRQWPVRAPTSTLDFEALARLPLAGGHIRSVALNAAFLAAEAGQSIGMSHLRHAAQREAAKLDRSIGDGVPTARPGERA